MGGLIDRCADFELRMVHNTLDRLIERADQANEKCEGGDCSDIERMRAVAADAFERCIMRGECGHDR